ncbi:MAG TPA: phage holin family protein [Thermoanaerobaculia bacterium]|jgi:putative membrane protein|nr:phage holin family protein [Thermoanaerobaculia bacterium]
MRAILQVLANALGIYLAAEFIQGIHYTGNIVTLLVAGLVLGLINLLVKPIISFFSFPFIVVTLGLFYLLINGLMLYLVAYLVRGFSIDGCLPAILGGLLIALLNWIIRVVFSPKED